MINQKQLLRIVGIVVFATMVVFFVRSNSVLPQYERKLTEFIPKEEVKETEQYWLFAEENFPEFCDWEDLIKVVDGDTIVIDEERRFLPWIFGELFTWKREMSVRFIGIDTPETVHPNKPVQPFGPEASAKTKELLVDSERVCLLSDELADQYDKYERRLAYIFSEDGNKWDAIFDYEDINGRPPEAFDFIGNDYVSFIAGYLWHHEINPKMNLFYGKPARMSVEMVFNKELGASKQFKIISIIGNGKWRAPDDDDITILPQYSVTGKQQNSRLKQGRFKRIAGKQYAYFLKDINTYKNSPLFALLNGNDLKGQLLSLTLVCDDVTDANISIVALDYQQLQLT